MREWGAEGRGGAGYLCHLGKGRVFLFSSEVTEVTPASKTTQVSSVELYNIPCTLHRALTAVLFPEPLSFHL